ncbi:hypothetical protein AB433_10145 [Croceicoccus naphthovorans]|uniref:PAS domain-containing protein n=2 Tax=Croceicoccus naphthovorans TaxID=1348774 RepID=A0A0G3XI17_9SPHN|nr:hypothetical protein AB433_10145 [Croceicoccus naphthovorans]
MEGSGIALTLADAQAEDFPLVLANQAFLDLSGYDRDEVIGKNCRFLQPKEGGGPATQRIRDFLVDPAKREERVLLPNERKDGTPFLNLLYLTRMTQLGKDAYILGSQFDFSRHDRMRPDSYDRALREDIRELSALTGEMGIVTLGTFRSLASSAAIIAEARLGE